MVLMVVAMEAEAHTEVVCMETVCTEEVMVDLQAVACMVEECTIVGMVAQWEVMAWAVWVVWAAWAWDPMGTNIQIIHMVLHLLHQAFGSPSCMW